MTTSIVADANMTGAPDEKFPYPTDGPNLSKQDCPTEDQKAECTNTHIAKLLVNLCTVWYILWLQSCMH